MTLCENDEKECIMETRKLSRGSTNTKVIVFGAGKIYNYYKDALAEINIIIILDNDKRKQGTYVDGHYIDNPKNIDKYSYDTILILSKEVDEIRKQLHDLGVADDKVIDYNDSVNTETFFCKNKYNCPNRNSGKKILVLSHSMDYTGAPLVLLDAVKILASVNYQIIIICFKDGTLRRDFAAAGATVIIIHCFFRSIEYIMSEIEWADVILLNTLSFHSFVLKMKGVRKKIIWWLHEEVNYYEEYGIEPDPNNPLDYINIYGVGWRVINAFNHFYPSAKINELNYGVQDIDCIKSEEHEGIVFALIGTFDYRKGEDIFFDAINKLDEMVTNISISYWVIGTMDKDVKRKYIRNPYVKLFGEVSPEKMVKLYSQIDIIVCPSRNDPMPVVVTEGMMMKKVCIVSENTGQSKILRNKQAGFICKTDNVDDLTLKMKEAIDNRDNWNSITERAYSLYKEIFSMYFFKDKLLNEVIAD